MSPSRIPLSFRHTHGPHQRQGQYFYNFFTLFFVIQFQQVRSVPCDRCRTHQAHDGKPLICIEQGTNFKACKPCKIAKATCKTDGVTCSGKLRLAPNENIISFKNDDYSNTSRIFEGPSESTMSEGELALY